VKGFPFVGAPPSGRWVVVCEAFRDEGVAPTKKEFMQTSSGRINSLEGDASN